jgi:hypothetical protein
MGPTARGRVRPTASTTPARWLTGSTSPWHAVGHGIKHHGQLSRRPAPPTPPLRLTSPRRHPPERLPLRRARGTPASHKNSHLQTANARSGLTRLVSSGLARCERR